MSDATQEVLETFTVELDSILAAEQAELQQACANLAEHRGINSAYMGDSITLIVEYQPFVISEDAVSDRVRASGLPLRQEPSSKPGILRRFINRLAEDNRQSFGSSQLDCCDLNKSNRPGR